MCGWDGVILKVKGPFAFAFFVTLKRGNGQLAGQVPKINMKYFT